MLCGLTNDFTLDRDLRMPSIDIIDPDRIRALYFCWFDHPTHPTRMDVAMVLCDLPADAPYKQRQVASSRLSGALRGTEKVSKTRWSHWLYLSKRAGIDVDHLREGELPPDPRRDAWPLLSRASRTGRRPKGATAPSASPSSAEGAEPGAVG